MPKKRTLQVAEGQRFGRLIVLDTEVRIRQAPPRSAGWRAALCQCDCGNRKTVTLNHLLSGAVTSCGCRRVESRFRHGLARHPLYHTWTGMMDRCHNPRSKDYRRYGARGIRVCDEWHDITVFVAWIDANLGTRPDGCSLDRIDNNGNYEPGNVRWATYFEQVHNANAPKMSRLGATTLDQRVAAARSLRAGGATYREIAAVMGVSSASVHNYLNRN